MSAVPRSKEGGVTDKRKGCSSPALQIERCRASAVADVHPRLDPAYPALDMQLPEQRTGPQLALR